MQRKIQPATSPIHIKINLPGSKEMTHRALMIAALADGVSEICNMHMGEETITFVNTLCQLGIAAQLDQTTQSCIVAGSSGQFPRKEASIWCTNSSSMATFLITSCAATRGVYYFDGAEDLKKQNFSALLHLLSRQGTQTIPSDATRLPFTLLGVDTLEGANITVGDHLTGLDISALLMIAPYARSSFNFIFTDISSQLDIDVTCSMMADFDVLAQRLHQNQIMVPVPQRYHAKDYVIEPNFSLAAYFFAAAAITHGETTIQTAKLKKTKQNSAYYLTILEKMGCQITEISTGITIKGPAVLQGVDVSMADFSDAFLALIAIAPFANSPTRISHISVLNKEESTRFEAMKTELTKMNVHFEAGENWIKVFPSKLNPASTHTHHDASIAMALAVIGLKVPGIVINESECVNQVFPEFFTIWNKLAEEKDVKV